MKESIYLFRGDPVGFMSLIKATGIPQTVVESQEYVFVGQAVNISKRILPAYSSKFSKKKYNQYQLFVILLCKAWRNVSYRDVIETISSNPAFIGLLSLPETPHFTTIQKFSERIEKGLIASVFNRTLKSFAGSLESSMMVDGTRYSVNNHSYYCDKRLGDFGGRPEKGALKQRYVWMTDRSLSSHRAHILDMFTVQRSSRRR